MKKKILYVIVFLFFIILVGYNYRQYIPEIPSRFAKYHNTGKITVVSDGKEVDLNGVKLSYSIETGEGVNNPGFQNWNLLSLNMFEWLKSL